MQIVEVSRLKRDHMNTLGKVVLGFTGSLVALAGVGLIGFQVPPRRYPPPTAEPEELGTVLLTEDKLDGLPAPVQRYVQVAFGEQIPRIESMMTWGRARAKFGLWMPLRFQLYHRPGRAFRRDMEVTWFGLPVLTALDLYLNGKGMTGPIGNLETGPRVDQGANLILWAEASFMPSLLVTDQRVRWEAINDTSARLIFPFGDKQDEMIFTFDPETGLLVRTWALRYQGNQGEKSPWYAEILAWQTVKGMKVPLKVAVTWENQGTPWSVWTFEDVVWNIDISQQLPTGAPKIAVFEPLPLALESVQENGQRPLPQAATPELALP